MIVFEDGQAQYGNRVAKLCVGSRPVTQPDAHWGFRWANSHEQHFHAVLAASELRRLKTLLERDETKQLQGYANAGPSVGDFKITIARAKSTQRFEVVGFQPAYGWAQNRALTELICAAKTIVQRASPADDLPDWCDAAHNAKHK